MLRASGVQHGQFKNKLYGLTNLQDIHDVQNKLQINSVHRQSTTHKMHQTHI